MDALALLSKNKILYSAANYQYLSFAAEFIFITIKRNSMKYFLNILSPGSSHIDKKEDAICSSPMKHSDSSEELEGFIFIPENNNESATEVNLSQAEKEHSKDHFETHCATEFNLSSTEKEHTKVDVETLRIMDSNLSQINVKNLQIPSEEKNRVPFDIPYCMTSDVTQAPQGNVQASPQIITKELFPSHSEISPTTKEAKTLDNIVNILNEKKPIQLDKNDLSPALKTNEAIPLNINSPTKKRVHLEKETKSISPIATSSIAPSQTSYFTLQKAWKMSLTLFCCCPRRNHDTHKKNDDISKPQNRLPTFIV